MSNITSVLLSPIFQWKWCPDSIVSMFYNLGCVTRSISTHQIGHGAICQCPGYVIPSFLWEWVNRMVPGPGFRVPLPTGSPSSPSATEKWSILWMLIARIRNVWEHARLFSVRKIDLCWPESTLTLASSYQHGWTLFMIIIHYRAYRAWN